jgi:hypothetical protein
MCDPYLTQFTGVTRGYSGADIAGVCNGVCARLTPLSPLPTNYILTHPLLNAAARSKAMKRTIAVSSPLHPFFLLMLPLLHTTSWSYTDASSFPLQDIRAGRVPLEMVLRDDIELALTSESPHLTHITCTRIMFGHLMVLSLPQPRLHRLTRTCLR